MFHINLTNEEIQLIHDTVNNLGDFQGHPGLNPPADLAMLGLPNVAGAYHFGQNQKMELVRILNAGFELLDLDLMVVFNGNRNRADEIRGKQETIGLLLQKIDNAPNVGNPFGALSIF